MKSTLGLLLGTLAGAFDVDTMANPTGGVIDTQMEMIRPDGRDQNVQSVFG